MDLTAFHNPSTQFRGAPFWAWNGELEPEELRRQIRHMRAMGLGGFFMHSRVGLATPYLSDKWMQCIEACADEADKLGMRAWLYDEDRWPSGAAGGLVTKNPEYRQRRLRMYQVTPDSDNQNVPTQHILAVFRAVIADGVIKQMEVLPPEDQSPFPVPKEEERILVFCVEEAESSSWYNGYTYLDTMNHAAVAEFIRITHEAYAQNEGHHFGKSIPGIFTDEPNHGAKYAMQTVADGPDIVSLPWTPRLPQVFSERYGYDIRSHLPELFFDSDVDDAAVCRYHYNDCTTFLFTDAFARQIGEWCEQQGIEHTGHVLRE